MLGLMLGRKLYNYVRMLNIRFEGVRRTGVGLFGAHGGVVCTLYFNKIVLVLVNDMVNIIATVKRKERRPFYTNSSDSHANCQICLDANHGTIRANACQYFWDTICPMRLMGL